MISYIHTESQSDARSVILLKRECSHDARGVILLNRECSPDVCGIIMLNRALPMISQCFLDAKECLIVSRCVDHSTCAPSDIFLFSAFAVHNPPYGYSVGDRCSH